MTTNPPHGYADRYSVAYEKGPGDEITVIISCKLCHSEVGRNVYDIRGTGPSQAAIEDARLTARHELKTHGAPR